MVIQDAVVHNAISGHSRKLFVVLLLAIVVVACTTAAFIVYSKYYSRAQIVVEIHPITSGPIFIRNDPTGQRPLLKSGVSYYNINSSRLLLIQPGGPLDTWVELSVTKNGTLLTMDKDVHLSGTMGDRGEFIVFIGTIDAWNEFSTAFSSRFLDSPKGWDALARSFDPPL